MARWLSRLERRPVTAEVVGSIPIRVASLFSYGIIAQLGEHLPYKQRSQVRALLVPFLLEKRIFAVVAQLAEQLICNQQVTGSSPVNGFHI